MLKGDTTQAREAVRTARDPLLKDFISGQLSANEWYTYAAASALMVGVGADGD